MALIDFLTQCTLIRNLTQTICQYSHFETWGHLVVHYIHIFVWFNSRSTVFLYLNVNSRRIRLHVRVFFLLQQGSRQCICHILYVYYVYIMVMWSPSQTGEFPTGTPVFLPHEDHANTRKHRCQRARLIKVV